MCSIESVNGIDFALSVHILSGIFFIWLFTLFGSGVLKRAFLIQIKSQLMHLENNISNSQKDNQPWGSLIEISKESSFF